MSCRGEMVRWRYSVHEVVDHWRGGRTRQMDACSVQVIRTRCTRLGEGYWTPVRGHRVWWVFMDGYIRKNLGKLICFDERRRSRRQNTNSGIILPNVDAVTLQCGKLARHVMPPSGDAQKADEKRSQEYFRREYFQSSWITSACICIVPST